LIVSHTLRITSLRALKAVIQACNQAQIKGIFAAKEVMLLVLNTSLILFHNEENFEDNESTLLLLLSIHFLIHSFQFLKNYS